MDDIPRALSWTLFILPALLGISLTCHQIMLFTRTDGPPVYEEQLSPAKQTTNLDLCSRWCVESGNCEAVSWEPGYCAQVGPNNIGGSVVNTMVYLVPKDHTISGTSSSSSWVINKSTQSRNNWM